MTVLFIIVIITGVMLYAAEQSKMPGPAALFCRVAFVVPCVLLMLLIVEYFGVQFR